MDALLLLLLWCPQTHQLLLAFLLPRYLLCQQSIAVTIREGKSCRENEEWTQTHTKCTHEGNAQQEGYTAEPN